jgi:hypothetical protein
MLCANWTETHFGTASSQLMVAQPIQQYKASTDNVSSKLLPPSLPWKEWTIANNFLTELNRWNRENETNKLYVILLKIDNAIDVGNPFLDLIPSEPFPAGGLVKGLASLIQVGVVRVVSATSAVLRLTLL